MLQKIIANLKHLPTTLAGLGAFLAALPQIPAVQALMGISPSVATKIGALGAIGGALILIFGAGAANSGLKTLLLLALLPLLMLSTASCGRYHVHAGAVNTFDSVTYDALIAAKATIDSAREQYHTGQLPLQLVPAVDAIAKAYDTAYPLWEDWRTAAAAGAPNDAKLAALNEAIADLKTAVAAYGKGKP